MNNEKYDAIRHIIQSKITDLKFTNTPYPNYPNYRRSLVRYEEKTTLNGPVEIRNESFPRGLRSLILQYSDILPNNTRVHRELRIHESLNNLLTIVDGETGFIGDVRTFRNTKQFRYFEFDMQYMTHLFDIWIDIPKSIYTENDFVELIRQERALALMMPSQGHIGGLPPELRRSIAELASIPRPARHWAPGDPPW